MRSRVVALFLACAGLVGSAGCLAPAGMVALPASAAPRASSGAAEAGAGAGGALAAGGGPGAGWQAPLGGDPVVTRAFDQLPHPYAAGHRGADLAGRPEEPVLSAGDGVVVFAGMVAGRPVVSVDHAGGLRTTYEPVDPSVAAGQAVARGSPIGALRSGHAGCPVQACLHWGLRRDGTYLDPLLLLRPPRVRLLPMSEGASSATSARPPPRTR